MYIYVCIYMHISFLSRKKNVLLIFCVIFLISLFSTHPRPPDKICKLKLRSRILVPEYIYTFLGLLGYFVTLKSIFKKACKTKKIIEFFVAVFKQLFKKL